jgi:23S rRNA pseudouridine1911/1915/1917 synthase
MLLTADRDERLDRFLARLMPEYSRTRLVRIIDAGGVLVDGDAEKPAFRLEPGMEVELNAPDAVPAHDLTPADIPLDVLFEDDEVIVVDKPRGLATHPASSLREPSLVNALLGYGARLSAGSASFRPGIVHRLDKDTSGAIIVAKTDAAHQSLAAQIAAKSAERRYLAIVAGWPNQETFSIDAALARDPHHRQRMAINPKGRTALTHVRCLRRLDQGGLLAVRLSTGRTHQIRVHLAAISHPVLGDSLYAYKEYASGPLQLHAALVEFDHPSSGQRIRVVAPTPSDFDAEITEQDWEQLAR